MSYLKMKIIRFETCQISYSKLVYTFLLYLPLSQFFVKRGNALRGVVKMEELFMKHSYISVGKH